MPNINVKVVGLTDPPPIEGRPVLYHHDGSSLELFVLNAGMQSGQPSVALVADTDDGLIVIETSLLVLLAGANAAKALAESHFGWRMPR